MLSRKFIAWVGVGVLSVATIPTFAAPHLARLVARKPAPAAHSAPQKPTVHKPATLTGSTNVTKKAIPTKRTATKAAAVGKAVPAAHKPAAQPVKKLTTTKVITKTAAPAKTSGRLQAIEQTNGATKATSAHKATGQKPSASSTAKKLLH